MSDFEAMAENDSVLTLRCDGSSISVSNRNTDIKYFSGIRQITTLITEDVINVNYISSSS